MGITAARGHGGQWLARVHQAISDGLVPDVKIVPVGVSYDCLPRHFIHPQVTTLILTMHTPLHNDPTVTISCTGLLNRPVSKLQTEVDSHFPDKSKHDNGAHKHNDHRLFKLLTWVIK